MRPVTRARGCTDASKRSGKVPLQELAFRSVLSALGQVKSVADPAVGLIAVAEVLPKPGLTSSRYL